MDAEQVILLVLLATIFASVLALGCRAKPAEVASLWRRPGLLFRSLAAMFLVAPAVTGRAIRGAQQKSNRRNPRQERVHSNGNEVMTVSNEYDSIGIGGSLAGQAAATVATSFRASDAGEPPAASLRRRCQKRRLPPFRLSSRLMSCGSRRWHQAVRLPTPASTIISSR